MAATKSKSKAKARTKAPVVSKTAPVVKRPNWSLWSLGIALLVLLMFGVGYALGLFLPSTPEAQAAMPEGHMRMGGTEASGDATGASAPSLSDLLPGLEAKVAAKPSDTDLRRLLAQTYSELGQHDKAIEQLRIVHKQAPRDNPSTILLATALLERAKPADLKDSYALLDSAVKEKPAVAPMARLYQGDIRMKQGDTAGAVKIWKDYVGQMSAADPRRAMFEEKIAQASAKP